MISIRYCSFASEISAALRRPKASSGKWSKNGARGYLLTHRARQVRLRDFEEFDRIVAMDDTNYHNLYRLAPSREAGNRIYRMSEFFREHPKWTHVPDPYYEGHEGFELVLDMLEDGCRTLLDELEKR